MLIVHSPATTAQMCEGWDNYLAAAEETFNTGKYILIKYWNMSHKLPPGCDILAVNRLAGEDQGAVCCQRESNKMSMYGYEKWRGKSKTTVKESVFQQGNRRWERGKDTEAGEGSFKDAEKMGKPERNIWKDGGMVGGSYRLACYSLVPWRSWGPLDTLETERQVSSECRCPNIISQIQCT